MIEKTDPQQLIIAPLPEASQKIYKPLVFTPPEEKTIIEVIEDFADRQNADQTRQAYRTDLKQFFKALQVTYLRELHPASLPFSELDKFITAYLEKLKKVDQYKPDKITNPKTVLRKAYSLSSLFQYLMNTYNYPKNPLAGRKLPQVPHQSTTASLTLGEMKQIIYFMEARHLENEKTFRDFLIFRFLFGLALRRHELVNLEWKDAHLTAEVPFINVRQKGGAIKTLPLIPNILAPLIEFKTLYNHDGQYKYIFRPVKNNRTQEFNKPLKPGYLYDLVKIIMSQLLPEKADTLTPHSFRKSFIEIALNHNEPLADIMNTTGHRSTEMLRYYDGRNVIKNNSANRIGNLI